MNGLKSAVTRNAQQLPIVQYDWQSGIRVQATSANSSSSGDLEDGAYLIVASAPIWMSIGMEAGDVAGSIYLAAGVPLHVLVEGDPGYLGIEEEPEGDTSVSALAVDAPATVSIIPIA